MRLMMLHMLLLVLLTHASDNKPQEGQQLNQQQPNQLQQTNQQQLQQQLHKQQHKQQHYIQPYRQQQKQQQKQQQQNQHKRKGKRHRAKPRTRDVGSYLYNNKHNDPLNNNNYCELELQCKGDQMSQSLPVKLPIRGPRGPPGPPGKTGANGLAGFPGLPGTGAQKKVAFFTGLTDNFGPVHDNTDVIFDRVVTNIGSAYSASTGRFTAPSHGAYQFNVVVSAQGREKAAVMVLKNGEMVATVWAESIPYWSTSSNHVVVSLDKGDQVWLMLLNKASHLHGFMYTTFSGFIIFDL